MRIHLPGLYHTVTSQAYSHCAFTGKVLRFSKMMRAQGAEVIEYGNEGSESEANEHVVLRSRARFDELHPRGAFVGEGAQVHDGSVSHSEFGMALAREMLARVKPGDIVAHPFGPTHKALLHVLPEAVHVETGIGYKAGPFGCAARIFESEPWRHWHLGRYDFDDANPEQRLTSYVVPNYYDLEDWPIGEGKGGYFAFMARKCNAKGLKMLAEIIKAYEGPHRFRIAGEGEQWSDWQTFADSIAHLGDKVINVGALRGRERAKFLGDAVALLCPTVFVEPFGGAAIEAMLCGTPAICSEWGAYVDTINPHLRCRTVDDYLLAMRKVEDEARHWVYMHTQNSYGLLSVGDQYANVFEQILKGHNPGTSS